MSDGDVQEAARLMVLYHGIGAATAAFRRVQEVSAKGDISDFSNWKRVAKRASAMLGETPIDTALKEA
jgi:hypothetical protein